MERPLAWVARRGIRRYISQILEAEATLARGDHIVEEMGREARERRKTGEQEDGLIRESTVSFLHSPKQSSPARPAVQKLSLATVDETVLCFL